MDLFRGMIVGISRNLERQILFFVSNKRKEHNKSLPHKTFSIKGKDYKKLFEGIRQEKTTRKRKNSF